MINLAIIYIHMRSARTIESNLYINVDSGNEEKKTMINIQERMYRRV